MGMLTDVMKAIEQIPVWAKLKDLPDRTDSLERRIAALEKKMSGPVSEDQCPKCGERAWFVESSSPDETFGDLGGIRRVYKCKSCGYSESKVIT